MSKIASKRTRQCAALKTTFTVAHLICTLGPIAYYVPVGYAAGTPTEKIGLSFAVITAIIMASISAIISATAKAGLQRCVLWIMIIGVMITLSEVKTFVYVMAAASILDELVFVKLKDHYKAALIANREIDRRG